MRARRVGAGSEFRLFQDEREIGAVDGTMVSFRGFASRDDAALGASAAYRALARRRAMAEDGQDSVATLLSAAPDESTAGTWGFQIRLLPSEQMEVFALARARIMWRALQGTGISRRMRQFAEGAPPVR
jgi:hypothetical protein